MFDGFDPAHILTVVIILLLSVAVHEAVHAFVAYWLGDDTAAEEGRLTLNPLKHVDLITTVLLPAGMILLGLPPIFIAKPVPFNPSRVRYEEYGAALIAVAGPASNLCMAAIAAMTVHLGVIDGAVLEPVLMFMWINIALFVFNMLPIPPLDGSRLLYAFAPEPVQRVMYQIESMGVLVILFILLLLSSLGFGAILLAINTAIADFLLPGFFY